MISKDKQYKTQAGYEVKIYSTDDSNFAGVHGAFKSENKWYNYSWNTDGSCWYGFSELNLVEVKERIKIDRWVNVYDSCDSNGYVADNTNFMTKEGANAHAKTVRNKRVACVKVAIDCEEGEGL